MRIVPIWLWVALALAAIGGYSWWVYHMGAESRQGEIDGIRAEIADQRLRFEQQAREAERLNGERMAEVAKNYEKGKADAIHTRETVISDLRAGNLRLRKQWQGCSAANLSTSGTGTSVVDDSAELRTADSGNLVRVGATADAQVIGLQDALRVCTNGLGTSP